MEDDVVNELEKRGVIDSRPGWQFFQEQADLIGDRAKSIREKMRQDPLASLDDEDRTVLNAYDLYARVAERRNQEPRYRLKDNNLYDHINQVLGDEA